MAKWQKTTAAEAPHDVAGNRVIEMTQQNPPESQLVPESERKSRAGVLQQLGRLKPLLPVLSSGLRMVDHGAVQALAHLLNLANSNGSGASAVQEELHHDLEDVQASHRELHLQVQDQTMQLKRIEDEMTLLRHTIERNATEQAELAEDVKSLKNLVRVMGAGLGILLIVLITLTGFLLTIVSKLDN